MSDSEEDRDGPRDDEDERRGKGRKGKKDDEDDQDDRSSRKEKKRARRDRDRSDNGEERSSRKEKEKRSSSRSRRSDRDKGRSQSPKQERSRERERRKRSPSPPAEPPANLYQMPEDTEAIDHKRIVNTVFVSQIHPKVEERDLFEFFSHVGRVEDIRMIRNHKTNRSKGLCYVEFAENESIYKAVALSGQLIGGYPITVSIIDADKQKLSLAGSSRDIQRPGRLYIANLPSSVTESQIRPIFDAFGDLDFIEMHKDPSTGLSRGFGFVQYKNAEDASSAQSNLNGLDIAGAKIKVGRVESDQAVGFLGELDDESGGVAMTAQSRVQLMARLQRDPVPASSSLPKAASPATNTLFPNLARIQVTTCVVMKNMFRPEEEKDPNFFLDIQEDVAEECRKHGKVKHIHVDKDDPAGRVYLCMSDTAGAQKLVSAFNGRWFAARQIEANFVSEQTYFLKFPAAKKKG